MSRFFNNKAKIIYFAFGIMMFVMLVAGLAYMTQYAHIRVAFIKTNNIVSIMDETEDALGYTNLLLYDFFENTTDTTFAKDFSQYANTVYDFQSAMSSFNSLIITYSVIGIICFAGTIILSNHNRNVYYKSNLYGGIILPAITSIFSIVMFIKNTLLMVTFNDNYELFNRVSVLMNPAINGEASKQTNNIQYLKDLYSCNSATFIVFEVLFLIVLGYSIFLIVFAVRKYKNTTNLRNEIIEKAVMSND